MSTRTGPDPDFVALQKAVAGRYSLERELGRGGMGVVYLARDVALDRPVALKLLPPAFARQPGFRERFVREARTAARLSHPHIVPIHSVEEVEEFVFFVMAFVEGQTLGERVRERGPVHPGEAARILREVSWALSYAHAQGVVHRDVKPDNILLEAGSGRALVTDFGIAHVGKTDGPGTEVLGTPEYMSPEQAGGGAVDGRSDIYALGVVGHYMLAARVPFEGPDARATLARQLTQPAPALATVAPEVPRAVADAVDRCLAKDPAERFQDAEELAAALARVLRERKEVPAAIRVFADQNRDATGSIVGVIMMALMMVAMGLAISGTAGGLPGEVILMMGLGLGWALVPAGMLGLLARRLLRSGYDHDDLVLALRGEVEERRRELVSEVGQGESPVDRWAPRAMWGGVVLLIATLLSILVPSFPLVLVLPLMIVANVLIVGGGLTAAVRHALRKAVPGERWLAFWESPVGRALFAVSGLGLDRGAAAVGSYRPTEIAIGMAAERLFADLPKDVRRSLGDLPAVVEALEHHAEEMRARMRELDGVLEDVDVDAPPGRGGGELREDVVARRASLTGEVRASRAAAEERLREVVAALEGLRLELLRLHAGQGSVAGVTADLSAARALSEDVARRLEGQRAVDRLLGAVHETPEPDTPVPA